MMTHRLLLHSLFRTFSQDLHMLDVAHVVRNVSLCEHDGSTVKGNIFRSKTAVHDEVRCLGCAGAAFKAGRAVLAAGVHHIHIIVAGLELRHILESDDQLSVFHGSGVLVRGDHFIIVYAPADVQHLKIKVLRQRACHGDLVVTDAFHAQCLAFHFQERLAAFPFQCVHNSFLCGRTDHGRAADRVRAGHVHGLDFVQRLAGETVKQSRVHRSVEIGLVLLGPEFLVAGLNRTFRAGSVVPDSLNDALVIHVHAHLHIVERRMNERHGRGVIALVHIGIAFQGLVGGSQAHGKQHAQSQKRSKKIADGSGGHMDSFLPVSLC